MPFPTHHPAFHSRALVADPRPPSPQAAHCTNPAFPSPFRSRSRPSKFLGLSENNWSFTHSFRCSLVIVHPTAGPFVRVLRAQSFLDTRQEQDDTRYQINKHSILDDTPSTSTSLSDNGLYQPSILRRRRRPAALLHRYSSPHSFAFKLGRIGRFQRLSTGEFHVFDSDGTGREERMREQAFGAADSSLHMGSRRLFFVVRAFPSMPFMTFSAFPGLLARVLPGSNGLHTSYSGTLRPISERAPT